MMARNSSKKTLSAAKKTKGTMGDKAKHAEKAEGAQSKAKMNRRRRAFVCDCHKLNGKDFLSSLALSADDLDLVDYAKEAAETLQTAHPAVVFTSGRRTTREQANAMAGNVVQNRKWIEQTYVASDERDALQTWIDGHPEATTSSAISDGLFAIMDTWSDIQKAKVSRHFSGQAFDVRPVSGKPGDEIKATIKGLARLRKFLESEGGLTIWHADFE
jgi:hypothetical protein